MFYIIGLAVASVLGIFGFVFTSTQKEKHDSNESPLRGAPVGIKPQTSTWTRNSVSDPAASGEVFDTNKKAQPESLYNQALNQPAKSTPPIAPSKSKKLPMPLAYFGILGSLLVSVFSLIFFFGKNKQNRRRLTSSARRAMPNQFTQQSNRPTHPPYSSQIRQVPRQVQQKLPPKPQPTKKPNRWPF